MAARPPLRQRSIAQRVDPCHLAWLLRPDVHRQALDLPGPDAQFRQWWALEGALEYPIWGQLEGARNAPHWFKPETEAGPAVGPFPVTPAFRYVMARRPDVSNQLDLTSPLGLSCAMAWFFVHGVRECRLSGVVPCTMLDELATPVPFLASDEAEGPCWLAFFAWLCDARLQKRYRLGTPAGNLAFGKFYVSSLIERLKLDALVNREPEPTLRRIKKTSRGKSSQTGRVPLRPGGVNLIGHAFGELGIGEDLRMAVEACDAAGIPYSIVNFSTGAGTRQHDHLLAGRTASAGELTSAPYTTNIFCLTAFETARFYLEHGPTLFEGRRNIGWWPWELPVWPSSWQPALGLVDEIWAASRFTQQAYLEAMEPDLKVSVRLMPLPVSVARRTRCKRQRFRLPARKFLFLYLFDANSWWSRKNPQGALKAFQRAFPADDQAVGLVLKISHGDPNDRRYRQFAAECAKDPRVHLISAVLDRPEVLGLMEACDAYVSLHRSEGFGRTLAEAMLLGKPVVGTAFSGPADFLDETTGFPVPFAPKPVREGDYAFVTHADEAWWAEPSLAHAAKQMRAARAAAGPQFAAGIIARAEAQFSPDRIGQRLRDVLEDASHSAAGDLRA